MKKNIALVYLAFLMVFYQLSFAQTSKYPESEFYKMYQLMAESHHLSNYDRIKERIDKLEPTINKLVEFISALDEFGKILSQISAKSKIIGEQFACERLRNIILVIKVFTTYDIHVIYTIYSLDDASCVDYYKEFRKLFLIRNKGVLQNTLGIIDSDYPYLKNNAALHTADRFRSKIKEGINLYNKIDSELNVVDELEEKYMDYNTFKKEYEFE